MAERGQGENLVVVYRAPDEFVAGMIKDLLEGEGIAVVLESKQVAWLDGAMKMGEGYWGDVVVPKDDEERAKKLIEGYHAKADIEDGDVLDT